MAEYTISSQYGSLFGMDVHARSTTVRGFDFATGETKVKRFGDCPAPAEIAAWMKGGFAGPHYAAYESGCTGFELCREVRAAGVECDVVAVSTLPKSGRDRKRKNDRNCKLTIPMWSRRTQISAALPERRKNSSLISDSIRNRWAFRRSRSRFNSVSLSISTRRSVSIKRSV